MDASMKTRKLTVFFAGLFFVTLSCVFVQGDISYAKELKQRVYYIYPPDDVSDERLKDVSRRWNVQLEKIRERLESRKRQKLGDNRPKGDYQPSELEFYRELLVYLENLDEEYPEWSEPTLWEDVDLCGCRIWLNGARFEKYNEYDAFGIPTTFAGLQRTKTWKEKHLDRVEIFVYDESPDRDKDAVSQPAAPCDPFSFRGWLIENSTLSVVCRHGRVDYSDAMLRRVEFRPVSFQQLVTTKNVELDSMDDIWLDFIPESFSEWRCGGYLCFNLGKHRVEFPQGFTRDQIVTSVLEESLESRKEIFEGIKPKDLYATNAYRNGDLTGVSFFPNRMKGVDYSLKNWNLSRLNLTGACFDGLDLTDVDFTDSIITDASFEDVHGLTIDQLKSTWNWKTDRMEDVVLSPELEKRVLQILD